MSKFNAAAALLMIVSFIGAADSARGATITSAPFSFGFGFTASGGGTWNTDETSGSNSPMVQGDFTFTPVVVGNQFDGTGPTFAGGTLGNGSNDRSGISTALPGYLPFIATLTGAYTGALPTNAMPTPNYRIQIDISQLSIYAAQHSSWTDPAGEIAFAETTSGNTGMSGAIVLPVTSNLNNAADFRQLIWNSPTSFEEAGLASVRTFALVNGNVRGIDGFEFSGTISLIYDALPPAPEPSSAVLLVGGLMMLSRRARKYRV